MTVIRQKVILTEKEINDYASGKLSMQDIAKAHGCTKDTVSKRLKETRRDDVFEQIQHNSKRGAAKLSEKQIQEIITRVKMVRWPAIWLLSITWMQQVFGIILKRMA